MKYYKWKKSIGYILYESMHVTFLKWQNIRNGDQIHGYWGLGMGWDGREPGVVIDKQQGVLVVMKIVQCLDRGAAFTSLHMWYNYRIKYPHTSDVQFDWGRLNKIAELYHLDSWHGIMCYSFETVTTRRNRVKGGYTESVFFSYNCMWIYSCFNKNSNKKCNSYPQIKKKNLL